MKKFLLLFSFFQITNSFAQPFGGNNAVWHYNFCSFPLVYCSPVIITSSSPVPVNGTDYYVITRNDSLAVDCSFVPSPDTVYESNDTVYYYLASSNRYTMLYNWNALPGDTQTICVDNISGGEDSLFLRVDSISTITINGFIKKVFHTSYLNLSPVNYFFGGDIIEDLGSTLFLFPQFGFCDPLTMGIRCYEDTLIGLYQPWMTGNGCDTVIYLGQPELIPDSEISVYPNPNNGEIMIKLFKPTISEIQIELINFLGQPIQSKTFSSPLSANYEIKLNLKNYPSGVYQVKMNAGSKIFMKKVIKN